MTGWLPTNALGQGVPGRLQIEGVLLSTGGAPAADGEYAVTFTLWSAKSGGTALHVDKDVKVSVKGGRWASVLGAIKPISATALASGNVWLGVQVGSDPELPRAALQSVAYALRAGTANALSCSGCVNGKNIAAGSLGPQQVGFAYAAAADGIKGGDAKAARSLACTGCVGVKHLKFDADVNMGARTLTTAKLTSNGDIVAKGTIAAKQFIGDGSKLSGIKTPAGECKTAGFVVKGINSDGSLKCVASMDPKGLPADGIDEISNGLIANQFTDSASGSKGKPIPDNNPEGVLDTINFPDIGLAQDIKVSIDVSNSDTADVAIFLFPPNAPKLPTKRASIISNYPAKPSIDPQKYPHYVLHMKKQFNSANKTIVKGTFPTPLKTLTGDIHKDWLNKNIKGQWRLLVLDTAFLNNAMDGKLNSWKIDIQTLSNKKVQVKGRLLVHGDIRVGNSNLNCDADSKGSLRWNNTIATWEGCDGTRWRSVNSDIGRSKKNPGKTCLDIKTRNPSATDGYYWLDPDGVGKGVQTFFAYCDQTRDGGGWMLGIKTWYRDNFYSWIGGGRAAQWGDIRTAPFTVKDYSFKHSDTQIKALIGPQKNFDVMFDQAGINSYYSYRNIEYVILRNYTADWRFTGKVAASSTPVTAESWHYDGTLLWQGKGGTKHEPKCGHVGGWGINCYGTKSQKVPDGPDGGKRCKRNDSRNRWGGQLHLYMSNTNTDSYIYVCNGAQHTSSYHLSHRYWFRERAPAK